MAQLLAPIVPPEELRIGLFGHETNHEALLRGDINLYADYTGTALRRYLKLDPLPYHRVYPAVRNAAWERWQVVWLEPFGYENAYGLIMRGADARTLQVQSISDLSGHAGRLVLGGTRQFLTNDPPITFAPGGFESLCAEYGLSFAGTREVSSDYGASFEVLAQGDIEVVADFVVNPNIAEHDLVALEDDRHFFAAYHAASIVRADFLERFPEVKPALESLSGKIDNATMARLNHAVEFRGRAPEDVAAEFLASLR